MVRTCDFLDKKRYTSSSGERRIRVHNIAVPVVTGLGEMYHQADTGAIVSLLARLGTFAYVILIFQCDDGSWTNLILLMKFNKIICSH